MRIFDFAKIYGSLITESEENVFGQRPLEQQVGARHSVTWHILYLRN